MTNTELSQTIFDNQVSELISSKSAKKIKVTFVDNKGNETTFESVYNSFSNVLSIDDNGISAFWNGTENPVPERTADKNKYYTPHKKEIIPLSSIFRYYFDYVTQRVETVINEDNK